MEVRKVWKIQIWIRVVDESCKEIYSFQDLSMFLFHCYDIVSFIVHFIICAYFEKGEPSWTYLSLFCLDICTVLILQCTG